jgi:hypothetical protein
MWFYMIAAFLILVGIIGGVASGGIFTLIFIPLGAIMLVVGVLAGMWGRASQGSGARQGSSRTEPEPLAHTPSQAPSAPAQPEQLADARRVQQ